MKLNEVILNEDYSKRDKEKLTKLAIVHSSYTGETFFDC
jgi:hypothetical protein